MRALAASFQLRKSLPVYAVLRFDEAVEVVVYVTGHGSFPFSMLLMHVRRKISMPGEMAGS
jgi:hypothetical protein